MASSNSKAKPSAGARSKAAGEMAKMMTRKVAKTVQMKEQTNKGAKRN